MKRSMLVACLLILGAGPATTPSAGPTTNTRPIGPTASVLNVGAKPDAPDWVRGWVADMPSEREKAIREAFKPLAIAEAEVVSAKAKVKQVKNRNVEMKVVGRQVSGQPILRADEADIEARGRETRAAKMALAAAENKAARAAWNIRRVQTSETGFYVRWLTLELGERGTIPEARVRQVVTADKAIVAYMGKDVMLYTDTGGMVDDKHLAFSSQFFAVTGTEQYHTVLGAIKTVYKIEPIDPYPFVTKIETVVSIADLDREIEGLAGRKIEIPRAEPPLVEPAEPTKGEQDDPRAGRGRR